MSRNCRDMRVIAGLRAAVLGLGMAALALPAIAADKPVVDLPSLIKSKVIKCLHPTVNPEKATVEVVKPAVTEGEISTTRFKVYYDGLVKKNSMDLDIMVRSAGSIRQMKVKVLADSGTGGGSCDLTKNWSDF